jgi:D-alanyl-D-alanine carboxypeptidase (penicillin-binding protein 5/6)
MSEYQALSAMLLPSANNVADSLAIWAFGSLQSYLTAASQEIQGLGLTSTVVSSDASGFNPATVSTAHDLVLLGEDAMQNPVIAQIVGQSEANLPVVGEVKNVNTLLGQSGIVGIKTGNTDQAGGVYIFAATDNLYQNYPVTIVGAIQGSPNLQDALSGTIPLLVSAESNFRITTAVSGGQSVGYYNIPWSKPISIIASQNLIPYMPRN